MTHSATDNQVAALREKIRHIGPSARILRRRLVIVAALLCGYAFLTIPTVCYGRPLRVPLWELCLRQIIDSVGPWFASCLVVGPIVVLGFSRGRRAWIRRKLNALPVRQRLLVLKKPQHPSGIGPDYWGDESTRRFVQSLLREQ